MNSRVYAVRGAVTVDADTADAIVAATTDLLKAILQRNSIAAGDVVSIIFTATDDLQAEFPAVAAKRAGLAGAPRLCARELDVTSSAYALKRCVRVLMHCYCESPPEPVYLGDAERLLDTSPTTPRLDTSPTTPPRS